jgi:hypothetical protein
VLVEAGVLSKHVAREIPGTGDDISTLSWHEGKCAGATRLMRAISTSS